MFAGYSFYLPTKGWRAESTLARYWTQDPSHEGPLFYQLSYPSWYWCEDKFVSHMYHICFWKLSDNPLVYGTITYPTLGLGIVLVVSSVLVMLLLWSCETLFPMVFSDCLLWSCKALFTMVFWSTAVLALLLPAWMLLLSLFSPWLLLINLFCTLLMAQWVYLHLTRASLRCSNSFWSSSGLVQTVLAL